VSGDARRIAVDGTGLNVIVAGEGPDVLLVHGFPDDHTVWRHQVPALVAAGYRVIAPDTRGCGDSDMPPRTSDYTIDKLVADLIGVLDALGVSKVRLVGHDWGAVQSWQLAIRHPDRVYRYVALSVGHPNAYAAGGIKQKLRAYYIGLIQFRGLTEFLVVRFNWLLFRTLLRFPAEFPQIRARLSRPGRLTAGFNYYRANRKMMFSGGHPPAAVPVTGLWSDGDAYLTERQMVDSARYCTAGWRYRRVDGANHWVQLTAPDTVNSLLLEALR
jgi:pimeloyl-ACP methyl ester carboxylesterase